MMIILIIVTNHQPLKQRPELKKNDTEEKNHGNVQRRASLKSLYVLLFFFFGFLNCILLKIVYEIVILDAYAT